MIESVYFLVGRYMLSFCFENSKVIILNLNLCRCPIASNEKLNMGKIFDDYV